MVSLKPLTILTLVVVYNVAVVWGLWRVGYWDVTMLYDTVMFMMVGAIGSVFAAVASGVAYDRRFFLKTILVNLGIMVLLAFLVDFFPFGFWLEFLVVVPLATLLTMLVVVARYEKGDESAHRFLTGAQSAVGLLLLGYIAWRVVNDHGQLMQLDVLFALGLPFVMSVLFVPVLVLVCALFAYSDAFVVVSFRSGDEERLSRWKKRQLIARFGLNLKALQTFRHSCAIHEYGWEKNRDEAQTLLKSWPNGPPAASCRPRPQP